LSWIKLNWVKELRPLENVFMGRCLKVDGSVREGTNYHDEVYFEGLSGIRREKRPLLASVFWTEVPLKMMPLYSIWFDSVLPHADLNIEYAWG